LSRLERISSRYAALRNGKKVGYCIDLKFALRSRIRGVSLDLLDLRGVASGVPGEDEQPLVAVEISEGDVGEEVIAERGLRFRREGDGLGSGIAEFLDHGWGGGPAASGSDDFAGVEFSVAGCRQAEDERLFGGCLGFLLRFGRSFDHALNCGSDKCFEEDEVLQIFGDGPAVGGFAEVPLGGGQAVAQD
jgi:hypothetical protein